MVRCLSLCLLLVVLTACSTKRFDTSTLNTEADYQSQASDYWKKHGWWSLPKEAKKIAITEFSVEYVTKTGAQDYNLGLIAMAQLAGAGKREFKYDDAMKEQLPNELYRMYVSELTKRGFEVVPAAAMWETETYKEIVAKESGSKSKTGHSTGNMFNDRVGRAYQHGQVYGAADTIVVDTGFFASFTNPVMKQISAAGEAGADTCLNIRIKVGIDKKGRATLWEGSTINVYPGIKPFGDNMYNSSAGGSVTSKKLLYFADPVIDAKNFQAFKGDVYQIDGQEYSRAIKDVFPEFAALSVYAFKK